MIWDGPEKPTIEDATAQVRDQARLDGTVIPDGTEPKIIQHEPSEGSKYGSLHVIFEWDDTAPE